MTSLRLIPFLLIFAALPLAGQGRLSRERPKVQSASITITRDGFDPPEVRLSPGPVAIFVRNRWNVGDLALRLEKEDALEPSTRQLLKRQEAIKEHKWNTFLTLPEGVYIITEESQPTWSCRIVVANERSK